MCSRYFVLKACCCGTRFRYNIIIVVFRRIGLARVCSRRTIAINQNSCSSIRERRILAKRILRVRLSRWRESGRPEERSGTRPKPGPWKEGVEKLWWCNLKPTTICIVPEIPLAPTNKHAHMYTQTHTHIYMCSIEDIRIRMV